MRLLILALSLLGPPQDPVVRELIQRLDDDSSEVREQATRKLGELDPSAIGPLREAALTASVEAKSRLARAIRQIENRQALRSKYRPAKVVSIDAKDRPLRELLDGLGAPIELAGLTGQEKVSLTLSKVPFWEALQRICAAREGVVFEVASDRVQVKAGKLQDPHRISGPFAIFFKGLEAPKNGRSYTVNLQACWEEGIKPDGITIRFKELKDDQGTDLLGDDPDPFRGESRTLMEQSCDVGLTGTHLPDDQAARISRLSACVGFHFALRSATATFKDATLASGQKLAIGDLSVHLEKFEERGEEASISLQVGIPDRRSVPATLVLIVLKEAGGRETRLHSGDVRDGRLQTGFSVGRSGPLSELRITIPTELHSEEVELDLRDLPIKR